MIAKTVHIALLVLLVTMNGAMAAGDTWYEVHEVLFDLLKQRGLDVPGEPREIS